MKPDEHRQGGNLMLLINAVNAEGRPVELYVKDGKIAAAFATNGDPAEVSKRYLETYGA